jgi:phosphatidylglycerol:prolipoprotein diacylglycerol transferase
MVAKRLKELGRSPDFAYEMVFAALIGGVVGAKLWFLAENGGPLFSGTGLTFYGGLLGGALGVCAWAKYKGQLDLVLADAVVPSLAAAYAIGRIGCQLAGDGDYGVAWDGPWAMAYPNGTVPTMEAVHPTPVYETLAMGLVAVLLWRWRHRWKPGTLFALWLVLAGAERFLVEFVRRNDAVVAGLTQPQLLSLLMMAGGAAWLWLRRGAEPAGRAARAPAGRARAG